MVTEKNINDDLKTRTISGMIWSFAERFGYLFLQFITNLVLARLLTPTDFGIIGMMLVFVSLSLVFIDGGFGSAIIQKKSPDQNDFSTVFFINIGIALVLYLLLYIFADNIANFYNQPQLSHLFKVLGLILIIDSFGIVQNNILVKNINFKAIAKIKITSAFISCIIAIIFAYRGFGVWSLIIQYILNSTIRASLLWLSTNWRPSLLFSKNSFMQLFGFSSRILLAQFISQLYINMQSLIIGRFFAASDLGFFTQAKQLQQVPVQSLSTVVNNVTFPIFSELQNEKEKLKKGVQKSLKTIVFINFPLMVLLAVIAKPLIIFLYTDKWLPSVPYFQLLSIGFGLLLIVHSLNLNVIKSIGRSDWLLRLEIIKKIMGIALIIIGIKIYGIIGILIALTINSIIEFFLNGYFTGKAINYGISKQIKDIAPTFVLAIIVGLIIYLVFYNIHLSSFVQIILQCSLYLFLYLSIAYMLKFESFRIYTDILKSFLKK